MGCGQSKIHLYPRKSKSKANGKKGAHADSDAETDEDEGGHIEDNEQLQCRERDKVEIAEETSNKDSTTDAEEEVSLSLLRAKNFSLLQSQDISSSQQNFFRMLDKKIEDGPDYDSSSETEIALEEARLNALVQHWESASITASICSSASRSLQTTPVRQVPPVKQLATPRLIIQTHIPTQQQQQQQQQILTNNDYMAHGMSLPIVGPISKQQQQLSSNQTQQQQLYAKMLQQQQQQQQQQTINNMGMSMHMGGSVVGGMNINSLTGMSSEQSVAIINANNSTNATTLTSTHPSNNGLAMLQPTSTNGGIVGVGVGVGGNNISPKRAAVDGILLISGNHHSLQQQQQQQQQHQQLLLHLQHQYNNSNTNNINSTTTNNSMLTTDLPTSAGTYVNGGRSPQHVPGAAYQHQQQQHQQLAAYEYYGQHLHEQQQQQQHNSNNNNSNNNNNNLVIGSGGVGGGIAYYGDMTSGAGSTMSGSMMSATPIGTTTTTTTTSQQPPPPTEYRFPPAISVQRLAPQVQRQLRETQELIKDSCPQLYATDYGSPGPPIRNPASRHLATTRRPTLETQFSQELS